ncbi:MAG: hypothetical protein IIC64_07705 [SAR324 cluster bacterium]|nr:hypothetical protein [SAR324 cluster bacterium]
MAAVLTPLDLTPLVLPAVVLAAVVLIAADLIAAVFLPSVILVEPFLASVFFIPAFFPSPLAVPLFVAVVLAAPLFAVAALAALSGFDLAFPALVVFCTFLFDFAVAINQPALHVRKWVDKFPPAPIKGRPRFPSRFNATFSTRRRWLLSLGNIPGGKGWVKLINHPGERCNRKIRVTSPLWPACWKKGKENGGESIQTPFISADKTRKVFWPMFKFLPLRDN